MSKRLSNRGRLADKDVGVRQSPSEGIQGVLLWVREDTWNRRKHGNPGNIICCLGKYKLLTRTAQIFIALVYLVFISLLFCFVF